MRWPLIHGAVSFRDGTYRTDVAAAGKVYRPYRGTLSLPRSYCPSAHRHSIATLLPST